MATAQRCEALALLRPDDGDRFVGDLLDIGVDERARIADARGAPLPCAVLDKTGDGTADRRRAVRHRTFRRQSRELARRFPPVARRRAHPAGRREGMSVAPLASTRPQHPYPGLRPFEANEWSIFFGRERMIDEVIERLARDRLVVIHGASGSGKSSLVRAGVMPKLARQHLRHGAPWLTLRCGPRAVHCGIWPPNSPGSSGAPTISRASRRSTACSIAADATLASVAGELDGVAGKSLCVLVDQFEELFRYEKETSREEAELFVDLIGRAERALDGEPSRGAVDVHVIVTMRSEFLGECARFDGLAETINRTQYLVPRMDDDALLRAVRRPALMFNGFVPEALAERLIASVRGREDELPLLQHGLMLMWDAAARGKSGRARRTRRRHGRGGRRPRRIALPPRRPGDGRSRARRAASAPRRGDVPRTDRRQRRGLGDPPAAKPCAISPPSPARARTNCAR